MTKFKIPALRFRSSAGSKDIIADTKETLPPALPNTPSSFDNGFGYKPLTPRVLGAHSEILAAPMAPTKSALKQTSRSKCRGVSWAPANRVRLDTGGDCHELLIDGSCLPTPNLPKALRPLPIAHIDPTKSRKRAFSESTSPPKAFAPGEGQQPSPGAKPHRHSDPSSNSSYFRSSPSRHSSLGPASPLINSPDSAKRHLRQYVKPLNRRLEALKMKDQVKWDVMPTKAYDAHKSRAQGPYARRRGQNRSDEGSWRDNRPRHESAPVISQSELPSPSTAKTQRHSESSLVGLHSDYFTRLSDSPRPIHGLANDSDVGPTDEAGTDAQSNPPKEGEAGTGRPSPMTSFSRLSSFSSSHAMDMAKEDPAMYYYPSGAILPPTPNEWTIVCEDSGENKSFGSRSPTPRGKIPVQSTVVQNPFEDATISPKANQSIASPTDKYGVDLRDRCDCSRSSSHSDLAPGSFHRDRLYEPMSPVSGMTKLQQALLEADTRWQNSKVGIES